MRKVQLILLTLMVIMWVEKQVPLKTIKIKKISNTFISVFPTYKPKYSLLVMLENPQTAKDLIYNYKGLKIKGFRNEAGWNAVYTAGKIIKKLGQF